jgi:hypothetical protein
MGRIFLLFLFFLLSAGLAGAAEDYTLVDRLISVPVESTRVVSVTFSAKGFPLAQLEAGMEKAISGLQEKVEAVAHANGIREIAFWGQNASVYSQGQGQYAVSGNASFLMTSAGEDEALVNALKNAGYTAAIGPFIMGRCGDVRQ